MAKQGKKGAGQGKKQAGGTLTGIIIGLIIGLLIAVGVAMTIKNTPLPFINKLGNKGKQNEAEAGQAADPNKPMYGNKAAVKAAAKDVRKPETEAAPDTVADAKKEAKKEEAKKPEVKPVAKTDGKAPVEDKSTADKSQKSDNADEKFTYYLQAGAFLEKGDAENTKARLALMGFAANIAERESDNGTLYRVRIGPFGQMEAVNRTRSKLTGNGVDVAVIRVPK